MTMNATADTIVRDKAAEWLEQLTQHGVLRWRHGETNLGLLLSRLLDVCGWQGDVQSLCDALPSTTHVIKLTDLLAVMGVLGFHIRHERVHTNNLKAEDLPALFIPRKAQDWHAGVVLREIGFYGLIWDDGREQHRGKLQDGYGDLYRFQRINAIDGREGDDVVNAVQSDWLQVLLERFRPLMWHAICLSLVMNLFTLAMPLFSMAVYDRVIGAHAPETLPLLVIGVVLALGVEHIIRWLRIRLAGWIGARSGLLATTAMFNRLLFLPASIIEQASVSAQLARIRAFESVRDFITGPGFSQHPRNPVPVCPDFGHHAAGGAGCHRCRQHRLSANRDDVRPAGALAAARQKHGACGRQPAASIDRYDREHPPRFMRPA